MNPSSSSQNPSKDNLMRKPSIKKPPEVRQTKTSLNRIFMVNPLLRSELEGKKAPTTHLNDVKMESLDRKNPNNAKNSSNDPKNTNLKPPLTVHPKPRRVRRSLSAQHIDRKKGKNPDPQSCYTRHKMNSSHSVEDLGHVVDNISRIYKSPTAPTMNLIPNTPMPVGECFSFNWTSTPRPLLQSELQKRLNDWLVKKGKTVEGFNHLKSFGIDNDTSEENVDLNVTLTSDYLKHEEAAKAALLDLHRLIVEGYDRDQCEQWLLVIRRKFSKLEEQPEFWNCKAAIEQIRENIPKVVECYQNAIIWGADIQSVDISLDNLCDKFNVLKTNSQIEQHQRGRLKIMQDVRSVFKSSIITVAVQKLKNLQKEKNVEVSSRNCEI